MLVHSPRSTLTTSTARVLPGATDWHQQPRTLAVAVCPMSSNQYAAQNGDAGTRGHRNIDPDPMWEYAFRHDNQLPRSFYHIGILRGTLTHATRRRQRYRWCAGTYLSTRRLCPSAATSQYVHYERQSGCSWDTHAHYCRLSDREGSQAGRIRRPICLCLNICRGKALSLCLADGGPSTTGPIILSACLPRGPSASSSFRYGVLASSLGLLVGSIRSSSCFL